MKKLLIIITIAILGWSLAAYGLAHSAQEAEPSIEIVPVLPDHSNCQYPNRLSNPPNGCDNSDPANPQCMKGGTEECDIPVDTTPWVPEPEEIVVQNCKQ